MLSLHRSGPPSRASTNGSPSSPHKMSKESKKYLVSFNILENCINIKQQIYEHSRSGVYSAGDALFHIIRCLDPKYDSASVEEIHADLKQWSDVRQYIHLPVCICHHGCHSSDTSHLFHPSEGPLFLTPTIISTIFSLPSRIYSVIFFIFWLMIKLNTLITLVFPIGGISHILHHMSSLIRVIVFFQH